jgi:hypothetical protein
MKRPRPLTLRASLSAASADRIQRRDLLAERDLVLVPVVAGDVHELLRRLGDRLHDLRVTVPGGAHGDARHEIEEAVAVHVPRFRAFGMRDHEWIVARVGRRHDQRVALEHRLGLRAR